MSVRRKVQYYRVGIIRTAWLSGQKGGNMQSPEKTVLEELKGLFIKCHWGSLEKLPD